MIVRVGMFHRICPLQVAWFGRARAPGGDDGRHSSWPDRPLDGLARYRKPCAGVDPPSIDTAGAIVEHLALYEIWKRETDPMVVLSAYSANRICHHPPFLQVVLVPRTVDKTISCISNF